MKSRTNNARMALLLARLTSVALELVRAVDDAVVLDDAGVPGFDDVREMVLRALEAADDARRVMNLVLKTRDAIDSAPDHVAAPLDLLDGAFDGEVWN